MIDTDNSGTITFDELKEGLRRVGSELMESEIKDLMDAVRNFLLYHVYLLVFVTHTDAYCIHDQLIIECFLGTGRLTLITVEQLIMGSFLQLLCT